MRDVQMYGLVLVPIGVQSHSKWRPPSEQPIRGRSLSAAAQCQNWALMS